MKNSVCLKPSFWASVSGGKDSLFMLKLILSNPDKYPLDGVVHFELEIDYPFIKDVINYMENECLSRGIRFVRIKPDNTWLELYNQFGFPTRKNRWCNSRYKLNAKDKLVSFMKDLGYNVVFYIGYCFDEVSRYSKRSFYECYPLVEEKIYEQDILLWARDVPLFNNYYKILKRCGCMYCPMSSMLAFAYLAYFYPQNFSFMIEKMKQTELKVSSQLGRPFSCIQSNPKYNSYYLERVVYNKYIPKLIKLLEL